MACASADETNMHPASSVRDGEWRKSENSFIFCYLNDCGIHFPIKF